METDLETLGRRTVSPRSLEKEVGRKTRAAPRWGSSRGAGKLSNIDRSVPSARHEVMKEKEP